MKLAKTALALTVSAVLAACSDSGSSSTPTPTPTPAPSDPNTLSIKAIDGYLRNAVVWLDQNNNYELDANEPQTVSGEGGIASLDISDVTVTDNDRIMVQAIKGQTIDEDAVELTPITQNFLMVATTSQNVVTPLTTLVEMKMQQGLTEQEAIDATAVELNISAAMLTSDYIERSGSEAQTAQQSAKSLVVSGIMPTDVAELTDAAIITEKLDAAAQINQKVAELNDDELIVLDPVTGELIIDKDSDKDGVPDSLDKFPNDSKEQLDFDDDGQGDNADLDDDNDGVNDDQDAFPFDPSEDIDTDGDGMGNNQDTDDDNDGYLDEQDNDPVSPIVTPATFQACVSSLPALPSGAQSELANGRVYQVNRENLTGEAYAYTQFEQFVAHRTGMPQGWLPDANIEVWQIVIDDGTEVTSPHTDGPSLEFEYIDAATGQYRGFEDSFRRWWGYNLSATDTRARELNIPMLGSLSRVDAWDPSQQVTHTDAFTDTYLGKEIIDTPYGLREVCVTEYQGEYTFTPAEGSDKPLTQAKEHFTNYVDVDGIIVRSERDYSEQYNQDPTQTWGYQNYVKQLTGLTHNGQDYGQSTDQLNAAAQPETLAACLVQLPNAAPIAPLTGRSFDFNRQDNQGTIYQSGQYDYVYASETQTQWRGHQGVQQDRLTGEIYNHDSHTFYNFIEQHYTLSKIWLGLEAHTPEGELQWGSETMVNQVQSRKRDSLGYRQPQVSYVEVEAIDASKQTWQTARIVEHATYLGQFDDHLGQPACVTFKRTDTQFFKPGEKAPYTSEYDHAINWEDNLFVTKKLRTTEYTHLEQWLAK